MKSTETRGTPFRIFVALSAASVLGAGLVSMGLLDRLSGAGGVPVPLALSTIAIYWALISLALYLYHRFMTERKALLYLLANIAVSLIVAEVVLRVLSLPVGMIQFRGVRSKANHHIYSPNVEMHGGMHDGQRVFVRTNEDGLRSDYSRDAFKQHAVRIVLLGDSLTFGFAVDQELTFPRRLEAILRERFNRDDIAILNAGIISYSPFLQKILYENVIVHYDPTVVISMIDATDIGDDIIYPREAVQENGRLVFPSATEECGADTVTHYRGALYEIFRPFVLALEEPLFYPASVIAMRLGTKREEECTYNYYDFEITIDGNRETDRFFVYRHPLEHTRPHFERSLANTSDLAASVAETDAEFALIVPPRYHHWNPNESPDNWEGDLYAVDEPFQFEMFRFYEEASHSAPFRIHSLLPAFAATDQFPLVFKDDPHLNVAGNEFLAESVADYLIAAELVTGPGSSDKQRTR